MLVELTNVGVISYANVKCDGLTIITGLNGSGKSSFEKALISSFLSLDNYERQYINDKRKYISNSILRTLSRFVYVNSPLFKNNNEAINYFPSLFALINEGLRNFDDIELEQSFESLKKEIENNQNNLYLLIPRGHFYSRDDRDNKNMIDVFNRQLARELKETLNDISIYLLTHGSLNQYLYDRTSIQLDIAFSGHFFPLREKDGKFSRILLSDNGFLFDYRRPFPSSNKINELYSDFTSSYKAYYISDGNIIDGLKNIRKRKKNPESFLKEENGIWSMSFEDKLFNDLVFDSAVLDYDSNAKKYPEVMEIINSTIDYDLRVINGALVTSNGGLSISSEASGSKIFAILKTLILKGLVDKNTVFLLDEPENHLHPEWQKKFGQCLNAMCYYIGCKIIVATHSPSLLLSLDVYGDKLKKESKFNVYFSEKENGLATFVDYTNEIEKAHKKLNDPYIIMDLLGK